MATGKEKILYQKISDLSFTADFKSVTGKLGFNTLADIAAIHVSALVELEGFTFHMLQEFTQYMQENNLANFIKQH